MGPGIEFQSPGLVVSASSHQAISSVPEFMVLTLEIRILHLGIKKTTEDGFFPPGTSDIPSERTAGECWLGKHDSSSSGLEIFR